jgi:hypothetical protein
MTRFPLLWIWFTLAFLANANAQPAISDNRYLFVLENSASMRNSAAAARDVLLHLIDTGIGGAMRDGDTYGIWTFNDRLNAEFPMQIWRSAGTNKSELAAAYVKRVRFERTSDINKLLQPLGPLFRGSKHLTVVLISEGKERLSGTPFDQEINNLYQQYAPQLRTSKIPFVTILASRNGEIYSYSIASSIGPIVAPNLAQPRNQSIRTRPDQVASNSIPQTVANLSVTNAAAQSTPATNPAAPQIPRTVTNVVVVHSIPKDIQLERAPKLNIGPVEVPGLALGESTATLTAPRLEKNPEESLVSAASSATALSRPTSGSSEPKNSAAPASSPPAAASAESSQQPASVTSATAPNLPPQAELAVSSPQTVGENVNGSSIPTNDSAPRKTSMIYLLLLAGLAAGLVVVLFLFSGKDPRQKSLISKSMDHGVR